MPKSVTRIDTDRTHGWQVRVQWRGRALPSRLFSDGVRGGRQAALQAAVEYRDQVEDQAGKPRTERTVQALCPRNSSGHPGIRLGWRREYGPGRRPVRHRVYFYSYPVAPGVKRQGSVSIRRWGWEGALERALQLRAERLKVYQQEGIL